MSDADYPHRVAHTLLTKVLDDVSSKVDWKTANADSLRSYKGVAHAMALVLLRLLNGMNLFFRN